MIDRLGLAIVLVVATVAIPAVAAGAGTGLEPPLASGAAGGADPPGDCSFPYDTRDATGTNVTVAAEPERVVTLNPSAAQTMWEIGAREKVVGLTKYASYLDGAASRTNVSGSTEIVVVETVVDLEPDLVLAPNATGSETVEQLREVGLTVYHFPQARDVGGVVRKTRTIGRLTGECAEAEATVAWMDRRIGTVRTAVEGRERPDVLYAFYGYTAGRGTFIHQIIEAAGGNNVAADYGVEGYAQLNPEIVVEADPDWIVRNSNDPVLPEEGPFAGTTAVEEGNVVVVPIEHLNQPAPRIVHGITRLAAHFHPGAYAAANATETATPTPAPTATPEPTTADTPATTATGGQPGFGIAVTVVAVAIAVLARRRRP